MILRVVIFFLLILGNSNSYAKENIVGLDLDQHSGVKIEVSTPFANIPPAGFLPIDISISNNSDKSRVWNFQSVSSSSWGHDGGNFTYQKSLFVEAGSRKGFTLLLPLANLGKNHYRQPIQLQISGYGVRRGNIRYRGQQHSIKARNLSLLVSPSLFNQEALKKHNQDHKKPISLMCSPLYPRELPDHWLAYIGFDCLGITGRDWLDLPTQVKSAIKLWTALGNHIHLFGPTLADSSLKELDIPVAQPSKWQYGLGHIEWFRENSGERTPPQIIDSMKSISSTVQDRFVTSYPKDWNLRKDLDFKPIKSGFIVFIMIFFAILIGPINFFCFAPGKYRYRLFWTTPALAISTSLVLVFFIIFQDGIGGKGNRISAVLLFPKPLKKVVIQEQISSTGFMLSHDIEMDHGLLFQSLPLQPLWKHQPNRIDRNRYAQNENIYSGDWFRSRNEQAHLLQFSESTREKIEIVISKFDSSGSAYPICQSSVSFPLQNLFYRDKNNKIWRIDTINTGESKSMKESNKAEQESWYKTVHGYTGTHSARILEKAVRMPGFFVAEAVESAGKAYLETSKFIRWKNRMTLYLGEVEEIIE